jgi:phage/plasmid primase-like uncharacterized protein
MGNLHNIHSVLPRQVPSQSFVDWAKGNNLLITARLMDAGIAFINEQAENLRQPISHLLLDNRWHYLDKPTKKQSYRGMLEVNSEGIPYLSLTYYTFRHGGVSVRFDSKAVLKALWQAARKGQQLSPTKTQAVQLTAVKKSEPASIPLDWVTRDFGHWQAMQPVGVSHYLKRKGLHELNIAGIRFAKQHIAVAIINTENQFQGLQRIFNDGQKRFTKGLSKKGHFTLIGEPSMPEKITTLHVCEGVATAASIHLATGEPVFAALDAFNLLPVCRNLKRHYPKTPFILWADNDWQKAGLKTKFGHVLGNTGLIQANCTAFKLRNARVCTPDFTAFDPDLIKDTTDFNDLHRLAGLESIINTLPAQPDFELSLRHELHRFNRHAHGVLSPQQFTEGVKETYHCRYLPHDVFKREGIHLVRSPIGTGKTAIVEQLVSQNPKQSILFTTHLISLVESAAQRLKLTSYNRCDNYDLQIEHQLAICLNSLGKLTAEGALRPYDIVIIDEIEQVLARLTSPIDQKPLVFSVLQHVMSQAKILICLDAHLSKTTASLIQRFCPDKPVTIHFNDYEPDHKRQIYFHDSQESLQMTAMLALEKGKKVYLTFNSKNEASKTWKAFNTAFPGKKGLYISGDNTGDAENQAFFNDVNAVSKQYDFLICTPSVSTGVSIDNGHFDFVGGIFNSQINTANDCMQALGRVRNHPILHVFCDKRQTSKPLNPKVIAAKWSKTHTHDLQLMNLDAYGQPILLNPDYENLVLLVTQARNASCNDFYQHFALLALHEGMKLTYFETKLNSDTQQQFRHFKKVCGEQDYAHLSQEQLPLTPAQLLALANKPRKTMNESRLYKKQQIIEFYNLSQTDEQSIAALTLLDNEGRLKKQIMALELALGDIELAKKRFLVQLENSAQFAADLTHYASLQQLYKKLLKTLHLSNGEPYLNLDDYQYNKESIKYSGFIDWIEANRLMLQGLITIPPTQKLQKDPLRFISMLLARLGLKQKRVGRAELGIYHLDGERIRLLNALLLRRKKGIASIGVPLDTSSVRVKKETPLTFFIDCFNKVKQVFTLTDTSLPLVV